MKAIKWMSIGLIMAGAVLMTGCHSMRGCCHNGCDGMMVEDTCAAPANTCHKRYHHRHHKMMKKTTTSTAQQDTGSANQTTTTTTTN